VNCEFSHVGRGVGGGAVGTYLVMRALSNHHPETPLVDGLQDLGRKLDTLIESQQQMLMLLAEMKGAQGK
jgi:hypothetical protein